jgi:LPS-assembly protein
VLKRLFICCLRLFLFGSMLLPSCFAWAGDHKNALPTILGWQFDPGRLCGGFFKSNLLPLPSGIDAHVLRVVSPHASIQGKGNQWCWQGLAQVYYQKNRLQGSHVCYANPKTEDATVLFSSPFQYAQHTFFAQANHGALKLNTKALHAADLVYRFQYHRKTITDMKGGQSSMSYTGWGQADALAGDSEQYYTIDSATFSTCSVKNPAWQVHARHLHLNVKRGYGSFSNGVLYWHHVPVFYWPYLYFPINEKSRTGFLYPIISLHGDHHLGIKQPFYWRLAPNMDALLTPAYDAKRHGHVAQRWRYLGSKSALTLAGDYWFHDPAYIAFKQNTQAESTNLTAYQQNMLARPGGERAWFSLDGETVWFDQLHAKAHVRWVKDDYLVDDVHPPLDLSDGRHLASDFSLDHHWDNVHSRFWALRYHTLQPAWQASAPNLYDRMPELDMDWHGENNLWPGRWGWQWQAVRFVHGEAMDINGQAASGWRNVLSLDWTNRHDIAGWIIRPEVQWIARDYRLDPGALRHSRTVSIPLFGLDVHKEWMRSVSNGAYWVIEPNLFLHYVPGWDNQQAPLFDTTLFFPGYNQLFQMRRFDGWDRIGDDRSASVGVQASGVRSDGFTQWQLALGQKFTLKKHEVLIDDAGVDDPLVLHYRSDLDVDGDYFFNEYNDAHMNLAWDVGSHYWAHALFDYHMQWDERLHVQPYYFYARAMDRVIDINQVSRLTNLSRFGLSVDWHANTRWQMHLDWSDNISQHHAHNVSAGIFYDTCCWSLGLSFGRYWTGYDVYGKNLYDRQYLLQFSLKGLGHMGHTWY